MYSPISPGLNNLGTGVKRRNCSTLSLDYIFDMVKRKEKKHTVCVTFPFCLPHSVTGLSYGSHTVGFTPPATLSRAAISHYNTPALHVHGSSSHAVAVNPQSLTKHLSNHDCFKDVTGVFLCVCVCVWLSLRGFVFFYGLQPKPQIFISKS